MSKMMKNMGRRMIVMAVVMVVVMAGVCECGVPESAVYPTQMERCWKELPLSDQIVFASLCDVTTEAICLDTFFDYEQLQAVEMPSGQVRTTICADLAAPTTTTAAVLPSFINATDFVDNYAAFTILEANCSEIFMPPLPFGEENALPPPPSEDGDSINGRVLATIYHSNTAKDCVNLISPIFDANFYSYAADCDEGIVALYDRPECVGTASMLMELAENEADSCFQAASGMIAVQVQGCRNDLQSGGSDNDSEAPDFLNTAYPSDNSLSLLAIIASSVIALFA